MTTYPLHPEPWLWEAYKQTVPRSRTLDEPILEYIARRIINDRSLDRDERERAAAYLDVPLPENRGDQSDAFDEHVDDSSTDDEEARFA